MAKLKGMTDEEKEKAIPWLIWAAALVLAVYTTTVHYKLQGVLSGRGDLADTMPKDVASLTYLPLAVLAGATLWLAANGTLLRRRIGVWVATGFASTAALVLMVLLNFYK